MKTEFSKLTGTRVVFSKIFTIPNLKSVSLSKYYTRLDTIVTYCREDRGPTQLKLRKWSAEGQRLGNSGFFEKAAFLKGLCFQNNP